MKKFITAHKIWTAIIILAIIVGGYEIYRTTHPSSASSQYTISRARMGNIVQTVTGTGQVSAANQVSIPSLVSGTIESIDVSVGQHVNEGDLIATIDPTNALNSLDNAKIALAKLTETPKQTDLSNAQDAVNQSYTTAFNAISGLFIDLQTVMPGMNSLLYGQGTFLSGQNSTQLTPTAQAYRDQAGVSYDKANAEYQTLLAEYATLLRQSATTTIAADLSDAYSLAQSVANTLSDTQNAVTYITTNQPNYLSKDSNTTQSDVTAWSNTVNGDVSSLLNAQNGITTAENALTTLITGADANDIQAAQLAVTEAQQTYDDYFIRAPFDGTIGLLPASIYQQASNGTSIATIVGDQKIATLSLDEVDAATVKVGDPVSLTFNAINNFTATGTVAEVDLVGTVSSGVVSYGVKVNINTADPRINPGMSVNATITTNEIDDVLIVPASAIKSQGNINYIQTLSSSTISQYMASLMAANPNTKMAATSSGNGFNGSSYASAASGTASSTGRHYGNGGTYSGSGQSRSSGLTIVSAETPGNIIVTIGATDGNNTQILSGLSAGAWVITKTATVTTATKTATPSLLSSLTGGARGAGGFGGGGFGGGAGGGARTTTAAPASSASAAH
jgi:HlyD family secretion protein